ncbi:response regulator [Ramlibacter sp. AW1]|uniref:Response regulator n=1 Tax=Ramlibacter aurantiacus TaxID=2801330 RepID=A0A936ZKK2_9BURK|nr:response regulator [Ramlibacter aurantiacus]MBL0418998.1 response regulator [Ramlibacter aurantiacus]
MTRTRILLVEDDDGVRNVAQTTLDILGGYDVLALASGEEALARAEAFAPRLLLLDVAMPGMDGPQTLAALRRIEALAAVPAVFLTARTQAREVVHYRSLGARDVIAKPFEPAQLCERVQAVLADDGAPAAPDSGDTRTALVVEDDPTIRYLLGYVLEQNGWRMRVCEGGDEALAVIEAGELPDAVLLDVQLPGVDGLTLLQRLRARPEWGQVPVMMLTAGGDESQVTRALALGADDYVGKPFDFTELVGRLQRLRRR